MKKLSKRDKKTLLVGSAAAAVILVVFYGILPFWEARGEVAEQVQTRQRLLQRSVEMIRQEEVFRAELEQLDRALEQYQNQLLDAREESIARVQLEEIVRRLAEENGVTVQRSNPLQERKIGERYAKITLQVNLQAEMPELTNFMYALSAHPKFLLVEEFYMNSLRVRNVIRLQPRMNISGFIRLSG